MRGGERVLEILCRVFPSAPIYTLIYNSAAVSETINQHPVRTSWLQRIPGICTHYRTFLPLFPLAIEGLHPAPADIVISTSHCVAKSIKPARGVPHLCYCFTPMRYVWVFPEEYFGRSPWLRLLGRAARYYLQRWDFQTAGRVDLFVAISHHVQRRIESCYHRPARVVHPPVNLDFFTPDPSTPREEFDLIVSALVPYKRVDIAINAYNQLRFPLKIVGTGSEYRRLRRIAGPNIEFLGQLNDQQVRDCYRRARFLIFPGEEDFGLVPLEAQACGTPVVALDRGGVQETVVPGKSGLFFENQDARSLAEAIRQAEQHSWDRQIIRQNAERFSVSSFLQGLADCIQECLKSFSL